MSNKIDVVRTIPDLRAMAAEWRRNGSTIALVPTMGALHAGHLSLIRRAGELADRTIVSIFVNPGQFAPHEDLARYPRDEAGDLAKLAAVKCDLVWAPTVADMYPDGFATRIAPAGAAHGLETDFRPHFFGGVATVCAKLFGAASPDVAVFGEKDYQQLCVVKQMVRDLDIPVRIAGVVTERESDGLALSSRNLYLSTEEREVAPKFNRVLRTLAEKAREIATGAATSKSPRAPRATPLFSDPMSPPQEHELPEITALCMAAANELADAGFNKVDYISVREADTLKIVSRIGEKPLRVLGAVWLGKTRLIDNVAG